MAQKVGLVMPTMEGPMTDTPFQTMAEVDEYLSGNTIECLICGESFQRLNRHLQYVHNIAPDDYRRRFGIPFKRSLTSVPSRAKSGSAMTPERIRHLIRVSQVGSLAFLAVRLANTSRPSPINGEKTWRVAGISHESW